MDLALGGDVAGRFGGAVQGGLWRLEFGVGAFARCCTMLVGRKVGRVWKRSKKGFTYIWKPCLVVFCSPETSQRGVQSVDNTSNCFSSPNVFHRTDVLSFFVHSGKLFPVFVSHYHVLNPIQSNLLSILSDTSIILTSTI